MQEECFVDDGARVACTPVVQYKLIYKRSWRAESRPLWTHCMRCSIVTASFSGADLESIHGKIGKPTPEECSMAMNGGVNTSDGIHGLHATC